MIKQYCEVSDVHVSLIQVDTLQKSKELPCVFNNFCVFYKGKFEIVNLLDMAYLKSKNNLNVFDDNVLAAYIKA